MKIVSNTSPINCLVLINAVGVLERLSGDVHIPPAVESELGHPAAPAEVRSFISSPPSWLHVSPAPPVTPELSWLDPGEAQAILLMEGMRAEVLLMDDRAGVVAARERGLSAVGTLGLLGLAAERGLVDLRECIDRLRQTTFRMPAWLVRRMLADRARE